jgi:hypothetical protein
MEGVGKIHPRNDKCRVILRMKLQRSHFQEWLLHHLGCLNDVPYGIASPSQGSAERSNIISGRATSYISWSAVVSLL